MPERFARIAALALIIILIAALPLLISLFGVLNAPPPTRVPPTQIAAASPTRTTSTPTPTVAPPTVTIIPTTLPTASPTSGCPIPATPEPLWVNPVLSQTNALTQKISVTLGRGREISIAGEAGTVIRQGEFSSASPVEIEIPLVPDAENHLLVTGKVEYVPGCFYTLQTRTDRVGNPLIIVQTGAQTPTPPVITSTPPAPGTVFLKPFSQVFALNQDAPTPNDQLWLYEADANAAFRVTAQAGAFSHLVSDGGTLNFWTLNDNIVPIPAPAPVLDNLSAGQRVEFLSDRVFACEGRYPRGLILGFCSELEGVTEGEVLQRARFETSVLYQLRINNKIYWVSSNVLRQQPN